ncbi:MAG: hypothetical protein ANABAC_1869 [Anaerolineae bacterium]|nr:MAG: hypothetical protein ANABAC_1869 [Anaerolineae bacterium]
MPGFCPTLAQNFSDPGLNISIKELDISSIFTRAYGCYKKPGQADLMVSQQTTLQIGQVSVSSLWIAL